MTVGLVTSGGREAGMGHVYECITLANRLEAAVTVLVGNDCPAVDLVADSGHDYRRYRGADDLREALSELDPAPVVFDHPALTESLLASASEAVPDARVVTIGNMKNNLPVGVANYADVVVNYWKHLTDRESVRRVEDGTVYLEGLGYLLFREEFYAFEDAWTPTGDLDRVLLQFGGSDPSNHSTWALSELALTPKAYDVEVVLGPGFDHNDALAAALADVDAERYTVVRNADGVARRMARTDVLVASPGMTTFEALFVGCPVVAVNQTPVHRETFGAFEFTYDRSDIPDLATTLEKTYAQFAATAETGVGHRYDDLLAAIDGAA